MITNNIKHVLAKSYEEFLNGIEPKPDAEAVRAKYKGPILDIFITQRATDKAKAQLGKDFSKAMRMYFDSFLVDGDFASKRLKTSMQPYEKNFLRHLGKDRLAFIKLLIEVADNCEEKRRGLLFGESA